MGITKIPWATHTANPIRVRGGKVWKHGYHCTKISPGCAHCYAEGMNIMRGTGLPYDNRKVEFYLDLSVFDKLPKTKPCMIFVQSMSDLFHEDVPFGFIDQIYHMAYQKPQHTYIWLTKRIDIAYKYFEEKQRGTLPSNIWLGVTAENQEQFDKRVPILFDIPATLHFISMEPMLELIDPMLNVYLKDGPHPEWVILGAESGPKRRHCDPNDMIKIVEQCQEHDIPVFVKQIHNPYDGSMIKDISSFPPELQFQQYPQTEREC